MESLRKWVLRQLQEDLFTTKVTFTAPKSLKRGKEKKSGQSALSKFFSLRYECDAFV